MAMRAMAESPALAQVCGIEVERVVRLTWIISGALAALAGVFVGLTPQIHPEIGFNVLLSLFAAAILGGTGSLPGAVVGGLLVGLAENLSLLVISPGYKGAMPFLLLLLMLDRAAAGHLRRAELDARLPRVLRVHRADPRGPHARPESAVGVHRAVQRRRGRLLRDRRLHARDPHRGAATPVRRQLRPALARGRPGRDGVDGARRLADRTRHDSPARRLPGHRDVRRRRLHPARRAQLGAAHRRPAGAHAHRPAARAAVRDAVRLQPLVSRVDDRASWRRSTGRSTACCARRGAAC